MDNWNGGFNFPLLLKTTMSNRKRTELTRQECILAIVIMLLAYLGVVFYTQLPLFEKLIYQKF